MTKKSKILLVDDEARFIDSLENILKHFNYRCTKAYNGADALKLLEKHTFETVLLDVGLPDISGCDIAKFIHTKYAATTVIVLTGQNSLEIAVQAMKHGAYDFLSKPIDHDVLLKTLKKAEQHRRLKNELYVSEQRFQILSSVAWESIVIHSDGIILETNQQFFSMLGYSMEDIAGGLTLEHIIAPSSSSEEKQLILQGGEGSCTAYALKKDGTEISIEVKSRSINYLSKKRRVCVIRDVSERLRAEEGRLALQKKLASASKLNALGLMAGSIAHDLNNILSGIVSYPDLLLMQMSESDKYYRQIKKIQEAGKRAASVVSDLVAITRGREQPKTVENLNELILTHFNSLEHNERLSAYPNVNLQANLEKNINNTSCSPTHIHKLLLNLIGNALEAIPEGGTIKISTENCLFSHPLHPGKKSAHVKLVVADNGPGISQFDLEHVFDPFYSTKVMGKSGSGLGLSIAWNIVQEHNGWIEVKDNKPGAVFEMYFPSTDGEIRVPAIGSRQSLAKGDGEKILIIDDQAEQNEILEESLSKLGYRPHSVTSGEKGLEFLKSQPVDLVLLDMIMGDGLNGRRTLELIRRDNPSQKAIIISGYAKGEEVEKTKTLGVSSFLEKPITISSLSTSIKNSIAS